MTIDDHIDSVTKQLTQLIALAYELNQNYDDVAIRLSGLKKEVLLFQGKLAGLRERKEFDGEIKTDISKHELNQGRTDYV